MVRVITQEIDPKKGENKGRKEGAAVFPASEARLM